MHQFAWITKGRHQIIPAPGDEALRIQTKNAVSNRVAMVMIVKEPRIDLGFAQRCLDAFNLHEPYRTG